MIDMNDLDGLLGNPVDHSVGLACYLAHTRAWHFSDTTSIGKLDQEIDRRPDARTNSHSLRLTPMLNQVVADLYKIIERSKGKTYLHEVGGSASSASSAARASATASGVVQLAQNAYIWPAGTTSPASAWRSPS